MQFNPCGVFDKGVWLRVSKAIWTTVCVLLIKQCAKPNLKA